MNYATRVWLVVIALCALSVTVAPFTSAYAQRQTTGCAGAGGGGTAGIGAALACGLPPPAAPTPQDNGNGVLGPSSGPLLGSPCIPTQQVPAGFSDPSGRVPSHQYVDLTPAISGNPQTGLTATGTIRSPLPIGSPTGPRSVAVPAVPVQTAAQQNADAAAEAQAIAAQFNAYQQQQIADASSVSAFVHPSDALLALLTSAQYTAADFYMPLGPPLPGVQATSEDATTWRFRELVYVHVGRVVHDQVGTDATGAPVYGPVYCSQLQVAGADPPYLQSQVTTTVPAFTAQIDRIADALWHSFRRGSIVSEPAAGGPTYIGMPTCVGIDTGLPTGSGTPNPFTLTLPLTLNGVAGAAACQRLGPCRRVDRR